MPVVSKAQNRFMQAAAHDPRFAAKAGITPATAREFVAATPKGAIKRLPERKVQPKAAKPRVFGSLAPGY